MELDARHLILLILTILGLFFWGVETLLLRVEEEGGHVKVVLPGVFTIEMSEKTGPDAELAKTLLRRITLFVKVFIVSTLGCLALLMTFGG